MTTVGRHVEDYRAQAYATSRAPTCVWCVACRLRFGGLP